MLRTLEESQKSRWKEHLKKVVHAYNSTVHEVIGFSPFFLVFGHEPTLPVDLTFPRRGGRFEEEASHTLAMRKSGGRSCNRLIPSQGAI